VKCDQVLIHQGLRAAWNAKGLANYGPPEPVGFSARCWIRTDRSQMTLPDEDEADKLTFHSMMSMPPPSAVLDYSTPSGVSRVSTSPLTSLSTSTSTELDLPPALARPEAVRLRSPALDIQSALTRLPYDAPREALPTCYPIQSGEDGFTSSFTGVKCGSMPQGLTDDVDVDLRMSGMRREEKAGWDAWERECRSGEGQEDDEREKREERQRDRQSEDGRIRGRSREVARVLGREVRAGEGRVGSDRGKGAVRDGESWGYGRSVQSMGNPIMEKSTEKSEMGEEEVPELPKRSRSVRIAEEGGVGLGSLGLGKGMRVRQGGRVRMDREEAERRCEETQARL
jgi:hypothetical protein